MCDCPRTWEGSWEESATLGKEWKPSSHLTLFETPPSYKFQSLVCSSNFFLKPFWKNLLFLFHPPSLHSLSHEARWPEPSALFPSPLSDHGGRLSPLSSPLPSLTCLQGGLCGRGQTLQFGREEMEIPSRKGSYQKNIYLYPEQSDSTHTFNTPSSVVFHRKDSTTPRMVKQRQACHDPEQSSFLKLDNLVTQGKPTARVSWVQFVVSYEYLES